MIYPRYKGLLWPTCINWFGYPLLRPAKPDFSRYMMPGT